jgi:hypothetical protein
MLWETRSRRLLLRGDRASLRGLVSVGGDAYTSTMKADTFFLLSDAALRSVIDRIEPADFDKPVPASWSSFENPTVLHLLKSHAYDEAWVPDVLAGKSVADGDDLRNKDLLGDYPIAAYDALNDMATVAVQRGVDPDSTFRFQYGEYPADEGLSHLAMYRATQAWMIAKHLGIPFHFSPELIEGLNEWVVPHADEWRSFGVFPPAIEPPAGADDETRVLCAIGFWVP